MNNPTYPYKLAKLKDQNGDLSKNWYIEFYVYSESINDLVRKRTRIPNSYKTEKERRKYAQAEIETINQLLQNGYFIKTQNDALPENIENQTLPLCQSLFNIIDAEAPFLRKKSAGTYRTAVNKALLFFKDDVNIHDLTIAKIYRFRDYLVKQGNSSKTANKTIDHLARLYTKLSKRFASLPENPFRIDKLPETQVSTANVAFTPEHQKLLETHLQLHYPALYLYTRYMYFAFIRPRELWQLRIKHVKIDNLTITIPGEISKNRKTENVPIIPPLRALVQLEGYQENYFLFGANLLPASGSCSENTPLNWHTKALKEIGLDQHGYTLYSWRHTGAVNAYLSGVGIKQLQILLRHSSVQITDIYLKSLGLRTDPNLGNYNW